MWPDIWFASDLPAMAVTNANSAQIDSMISNAAQAQVPDGGPDVQQVVVTSPGDVHGEIINSDELPAEAMRKFHHGMEILEVCDDGVCRAVYELPKPGEVCEITCKQTEDDGWHCIESYVTTGECVIP